MTLRLTCSVGSMLLALACGGRDVLDSDTARAIESDGGSSPADGSAATNSPTSAATSTSTSTTTSAGEPDDDETSDAAASDETLEVPETPSATEAAAETETSYDGGSSDSRSDAGHPVDPVRDAGPSVPTRCAITPTSQLLRLSTEQYRRTIRDLLNVTALSAHDNQPPSALLSPDESLATPTPEAYQAAAAAIAEEVMADTDLRAGFVTCEPIDAQCLHDTAIAFGRRAYRRPLTESEVTALDELLAATSTDDPSGEASARLLLETLLTSPSFLFRAETGASPNAEGYFALSAHEIATRLSYMLWGSTPDAVLDAAADAGELATPEQIEAQARRMLDDAKAREMIIEFHRAYARMNNGGHWDNISKDSQAFPLFSPNAVPVLIEEMERFFEAVVSEEQGTFSDLFLSTRAFVNADTAALYGLDPANYGPELSAVELAPDRPGFLTRAGFLAANARFDETSPILRGAFVMRDVLGIDPGPPPPQAGDPSAMAVPGDTVREQVTSLTSDTECNACHMLINPPGFVLEAFDATGASQSVEAATGAPIDTAADVYLEPDDTVWVSGPFELMNALATSRRAQRHYVQRWFEFAYQRQSPLDQCFIDELASRFVGTDASVVNLIADLTQVDAFRLRATNTSEPGSTPGR